MDFNSLLQQSSAHAWLYLPVAVLLGGLHGLEPGHSKTMMAAFIVAVRGTVTQAVLLGLSAAISHSLIIWALAAMALRFGNQWRVETAEPYFLIGTGLIVVAMALWTLWRLRRGRGHHHHHHHHHDEHDHGHAEEERTLDFAGGTAVLSIFEDGVPPRFRVVSASESLTPLRVKTIRPNGDEQSFTLVRAGGFWESAEEIPEPHAFEVKLTVAGTEGEQTLATHFTEHDHHHDHHHDHDHHHHHQGHDDEEDDDEHTRQHAEQIRRRFDGREVTTTQIVLFGLTGGLMPCPAALSILLVCLQVKKFTLGFSMVAAFSLGLALTLVAVGVTAAWGIRKVSHGNGFLSRLAHRAPQISSWVLIALGSVFMLRGFWQLP